MAERVLKLESPAVTVKARWNGTFYIEVDCWRPVRGRKTGRHEENIILKFEGLSPGELECIVGSIGQAVREQESRLDDIRNAF